MSAPLLINRKWTKAQYKAMRRITRYLWWKYRYEEKCNKALVNMMLYGHGTIKIAWDGQQIGH